MPKGHFTCFHSGMHGGERDKATKFCFYNPREPSEYFLAPLGLERDQQHDHQSWRPRFWMANGFTPLKKKRLVLCPFFTRMASIFLEEAIARNLGPVDDLAQQLQYDHTVGKRQLFATQARQQRLHPIGAEFGYILKNCGEPQCSTSICAGPHQPEGLKNFITSGAAGVQTGPVLAIPHAKMTSAISEGEAIPHAKMTSAISEGETCELIKVGVPRDPLQFIEAAVALGHPRFLLARMATPVFACKTGFTGLSGG